ncbi:hypothetical protein BDZ94DRAFT_854428 [Collybia nuda]|uniref:DUF6534 domain-containing protein n=1 Tax=Collybia nuda TaxID=64659 RepID=A0A9P5Y4R1_9AGAR|nr:hypothetical protein BDZ94DRAFT_854428 [Collybia nuda]
MSSEVTPNGMFGPMLIGLVIATMFSGVAIVQVITFMRHCDGDPLAQKLMVLFLWFLDMLHVSLMFHLVYHYLVSHPTDELLVWSFPAHILIQLTIMPVAHGVYLIRIWKITTSTRKYIPIALGCLVFLNLVAGILIAIKLFQCPDFLCARAVPVKPVVISVLALTFCIDFLIALSLGHALSKAGTNLNWTNSSFTMLLAYFINTGAIVGLFSLSCLVAFLASQHSLILVSIDAITTRLYVNSLLGMVNARHYFQPAESPTPLDLRPGFPSLRISVNRTSQRPSKTINEVGLPLFQPSPKSEDIMMLEVMVKQEAHSRKT